MIRSRGIRFWVDGFFIRGNEFVIFVAFSHLFKEVYCEAKNFARRTHKSKKTCWECLDKLLISI